MAPPRNKNYLYLATVVLIIVFVCLGILSNSGTTPDPPIAERNNNNHNTPTETTDTVDLNPPTAEDVTKENKGLDQEVANQRSKLSLLQKEVENYNQKLEGAKKQYNEWDKKLGNLAETWDTHDASIKKKMKELEAMIDTTKQSVTTDNENKKTKSSKSNKNKKQMVDAGVRRNFWEHDFDSVEELSEEGLSEDVTFLFGIINMNRKAHLGIQNYSFENDYLHHLSEILLKNFKGQKIQIIIESKYNKNVEPLLKQLNSINGTSTKYAIVRNVETSDLRSWKHYKDIERIRNSNWWKSTTGWLSGSPQGYSDLYNPIVMHKLLWLSQLATDNPFKTKYFMWLDCGGICTPNLAHRGMQVFKDKAMHYMQHKFLSVLSPYPNNHEIHGCHRETMYQFTKGLAPAFVVKGWVMGGSRNAVKRVEGLYKGLLEETLRAGCLGTEETVLTIAVYGWPEEFTIYFNADPKTPFEGGDFCALVNREEDINETVGTKWAEWVKEQIAKGN